MRGKISELRQTIRDRILSVNPLPYKQGTTNVSWKEARRPYRIQDDSHARKHLLFSVDVGSVSVGNTSRANAIDGYDLIADVRVQFLYRIRASDVDDEDSAADAAEAVASAILTQGPYSHRYDIVPAQVFTNNLTPDGESLLVEQRYSVGFTIPFPVGV